MFFGEYGHKVNAKNQVTVPASYRAGDRNVFHLIEGKSGCVYMFTEEGVKKIAHNLQTDSAGSDTDFTRMLFSRIKTVECDPTGRIVLPQELRDQAGIGDTVVFVGVATRIELWSPERWESYKGTHTEHYRARFDDIVEDIFERQG